MICWDVTGITDDATFHAQSSKDSYTVKYEEHAIWRERPMGILGTLENSRH